MGRLCRAIRAFVGRCLVLQRHVILGDHSLFVGAHGSPPWDGTIDTSEERAIIAGWRAGPDGLYARIAGRFMRAEVRERARRYLTGLPDCVDPRNGWQLAEQAERAVRLRGGAPGRGGVLVVDDDLRTSGASADGRAGFQRLVAEVVLGRVGIILGMEMSRLSRSCRD